MDLNVIVMFIHNNCDLDELIAKTKKTQRRFENHLLSMVKCIKDENSTALLPV